MSDSYTGKLISKLYSLTDDDKIEELIEEIEELNDPVFIAPILDAYKVHQKRFYSHYFLAALDSINSPDITRYVVEILKETLPKKDYYYLIKILLHRDYFDGDIAQQWLKMILEDLEGVDEWDLEIFVPYFKNSGLLIELAGVLEQIFTKNNLKKEVRINALHEWIKLDPKKSLEHIILNFGLFANDESVLCVLSKVIIKWKESSLVTKIISSIRTTNNTDAIRILDLYEKKTKEAENKKNENQQSEIKKDYSNAHLIDSIGHKRNKINFLSTSITSIGFELFPPDETLLHQLKRASERSALEGICVHFRGYLQHICPEVKNHGLNDDEVKILLPNTDSGDYTKSLIRLYLFLYSRGFQVDINLGGIQKLNKFLNIFGGHPNDIKDLIKQLKISNLDALFVNEDWQGIHQFILEEYEKALDYLIEILQTKIVS